jgi:glycogen debranching enzyme
MDRYAPKGVHVSEPLPVAPPTYQLTTTVFAPATVMCDPGGQIRGPGMPGLYVGDRRALCEAALLVGGYQPAPLIHVSEGPGHDRFISVVRELGEAAFDPTVRVDRIRRVRPDGLDEQIRISSTAAVTVHADVTVSLASDVARLNMVRSRPTQPVAPEISADAITWTRQGVRVVVTATGQPPSADAVRLSADETRMPAHQARLSADGLTWTVALPPGGEMVLGWSARLTGPRPLVSRPVKPVEWQPPTVVADDPRLARLLTRSLSDLSAMRLVDPDSPRDTFIAAGAPRFLTLFGRDSLWVARMMLPLGTELAAGTLRTLARRQGERVDEWSGEAPGKIMHELREEDGRLPPGTTSPAVYYGTVDATLLWIALLHEAWRWGMPAGEVAALLPALEAALGWLDRYADTDGDGFVEYFDVNGEGLANQGWKDSSDAVRRQDGTIAAPPIALCEVQGYAYQAATAGAALLDAFDRPGVAHWCQYAAELAQRFRDRFWVDRPGGGFPALALDRDKRQVDSLTSNIGHLLGTGLLNDVEARQIATLMGSPELADGYGLRTMSRADSGYRSLSYHCGSIWPHDTAIVALGLSTVGATTESAALIRGLLAAAEAFEFTLPELYGADPSSALPRPLPHPSACRPQAWAAAASVAILQAALGLWSDVPRGEFGAAPLAGAPLGAITVRGLRAGPATFDLELDRAGAVRVTQTTGNLRVCTGRPALERPTRPT